MKTVAVSILTAALATVPASAQEEFPRIVGTWTGEGLGVARTGEGPVEYADDAVTQVVTEQKGRRFAGEIRSTSGGEAFSKPFVGVFVDATNFLWSEPSGIVQGRLVDGNTILSCYAHTGETPLIAACNTLTRTPR